jgi:hypothetical protein
LVQLTDRDEAMLDWLGVVGQADLEAIRWALTGLLGRGTRNPVGLRRAQRWVTRMAEVGLVGRDQPAIRNGSVVWATHNPALRPPDLYKQTRRHELAVAIVSARYLAAGFEWSRDRRPLTLADHQADGVAVKGDRVEVIEVELTQKTRTRYQSIHSSHADRLEQGVSRIVYVCTEAAARTVEREADRWLFRDIRPRLVTLPAVDGHGRWIASDDALWADMPDTVPAPHLSTPELFERSYR